MNPPRVVYDTMVFFQWAALRPGARSGTSRAVEEGRVRLCVSPVLLAEVHGLLARPAIRANRPHLTDARVRAVLGLLSDKAELSPTVPPAFSHALHKKDDHIFNLAIASRAEFLITWEVRHLEMARTHPDDTRRLAALAPGSESWTRRPSFRSLRRPASPRALPSQRIILPATDRKPHRARQAMT